jgi:hypothetical protein
MVVKFRNTTWPPTPQLSLHRRAALSSYSNGTQSYIAERTQNAVYIVRCLWFDHGFPDSLLWAGRTMTVKSHDVRHPFLCKNNNIQKILNELYT